MQINFYIFCFKLQISLKSIKRIIIPVREIESASQISTHFTHKVQEKKNISGIRNIMDLKKFIIIDILRYYLSLGKKEFLKNFQY